MRIEIPVFKPCRDPVIIGKGPGRIRLDIRVFLPLIHNGQIGILLCPVDNAVYGKRELRGINQIIIRPFCHQGIRFAKGVDRGVFPVYPLVKHRNIICGGGIADQCARPVGNEHISGNVIRIYAA